MTPNDRAIAKYLRDRIPGVCLEDGRAVVRVLNEMEESLGMDVVGATRSLLRAVAEEGAPQLVKELAKGSSCSTTLDAIAAALAEKRHLDPLAAVAAVRIWAAALGEGESPAAARSTATGERLGSKDESEQSMNTFRNVLLAAILIAAAVAIGYYCFSDVIAKGARMVALAIPAILYLFVLRELGLILVASWPARKLWEGVRQIARFFDRIPGAVYVILLALGICDAFRWLPYGVRDIAAQLPKRTSSAETQPAPKPQPPLADRERAVRLLPPSLLTPPSTLNDLRSTAPIPTIRSSRPTPPATINEVQKPNQSVPQQAQQVAPISPLVEHAPARPVKPEVSRQKPLRSGPSRTEQPADASEAHGQVRSTESHVLEFHVPQHGNDPLHITVNEPVQADAVVSTTWRGKPIELQVRRPLATSSPRTGASRWLAVLVDPKRTPVVASP